MQNNKDSELNLINVVTHALLSVLIAEKLCGKVTVHAVFRDDIEEA